MGHVLSISRHGPAQTHRFCHGIRATESAHVLSIVSMHTVRKDETSKFQLSKILAAHLLPYTFLFS